MLSKNIIKKELFTNYHPELIQHLTKTILQTSLILNILLPTIFISLSYEYVPSLHIQIWGFLHIFIFISRLFVKNKLSFYIKSKNIDKLNIFLSIYIFLIFATSVIIISYCFNSIIYNVPSKNLVIMILIIVAISSGAVTSLGTIFIGYLLFISINLLSLSIMLLYIDYNMYYIYSLSIFLLYVALVPLGYRNFETLSNAIYSQETFKTIYNKSTDGIALIKNNTFYDCNESIVKMFGYDNKTEFLNTHISKFIPHKQPDGTNSIKKMLKMLNISYKNDSNNFEWLHVTKQGKEFWTEIVLTKIYLNKEYYIHGIWRDITQRKELENIKEQSKKEIEELNKSLEDKVNSIVNDLRKKDKLLYEQTKLASMGEMIANIAHQWRQPLSIISTLATSTKLNKELDILSDEKLLNNMDLIDENSQYLSRTIDDFRNFIKTDAKKINFNITENINKFLNLTISSIKKNNIKIILDMQENIYIQGHPNELIQCFLNIFNNSKDALESINENDRYIFISSRKIQNNILIDFKDNANGIDENIISKIFEPYFTTKHQSQGTGIGLNMTYQIITKMNGTITATNQTYTYNDKTYKGALFRITLPLSQNI